MEEVVTSGGVPHRLTFTWKRHGECALVITAQGRRVLLNPDATMVWELLDDRRTVDEVVKRYSQAAGCDGEDAAARVTQTLELFLQEGLITFKSFLWKEG
ncbi:MAG: PqqD family protein [Acetobacteraceae bacterium]|nr:PqqD family protein [Acetobacteraceae bacterium]